jgi:hypothetical protein
MQYKRLANKIINQADEDEQFAREMERAILVEVD